MLAYPRANVDALAARLFDDNYQSDYGPSRRSSKHTCESREYGCCEGDNPLSRIREVSRVTRIVVFPLDLL